MTSWADGSSLQIDRTKFLILVSFVAQGCGPDAAAPVSVPVVTDSATPHVDPPKVSASRPRYPAGEGTMGAGRFPAGEGGGYYPADEASEKTLLVNIGIAPGKWRCTGDDDVGTVGSCSGLKPATCRTSFSESVCLGASLYTKPKIAQRVLECLDKAKAPSGELCYSKYGHPCRKAALASACSDASVDLRCKTIQRGCPGVALGECRKWMSGLNDSGRGRVEACLGTADGCRYGVYSCVEGLDG